jgi:glycosyltransferase involved in cell wall biosynthesis
MRVSVCLPAYNGDRYIAEQLASILRFDRVDEVLLSDDGSSDRTLAMIDSMSDPRLRLLRGPGRGLAHNIEFLLHRASGEIIFLSDQDDVWLPGKVEAMLQALQSCDLVVSDCSVVDADLNVLHPSFFALRGSRPGVLRNLLRNRYLGCCMAFRREVLGRALPFPAELPMHDWWIGLVADAFFRVRFIDRPLLLYRRHGANTSPTSERSKASLRQQLFWRWRLASQLALRAMSLQGPWRRGALRDP